ncbi:MAG: hypothetical protein M1505_00815 [Patescibacteria group bacterium]|nr:hypothetical protein [Patescibacteria group bacterium]
MRIIETAPMKKFHQVGNKKGRPAFRTPAGFRVRRRLKTAKIKFRSKPKTKEITGQI